MPVSKQAEGDKLSLIVDGHEHHDWETAEVDSDLLTPADAWRVSLGLPSAKLPAYLAPWAPVTLAIGGQVVMRGRIDTVEPTVGYGEHTLALAGRDLAAELVDCSAPLFTVRHYGLAEIVAKMVRPLGITNIRVVAGNATHDKISVDPGITVWDALQRVCAESGCWPYMAPDGTLVIGGPDYSDATNPAVGQLTLRESGQGNNVLRLGLRRSVQDWHSPVTVLGQAHGGVSSSGAHNIKATAKDAAAHFNRPKIVVEADCDNVGQAQRRARKIVADGKLASFEIHATVAGYRVLGAVSPSDSGGAPLWTPGQRVRVLSEPHNLDGVYYLMRRTFLCSRSAGHTTELVLKPDALWQPDVAHHNRHHFRKGKKGRNSLGPGEIVDL